MAAVIKQAENRGGVRSFEEPAHRTMVLDEPRDEQLASCRLEAARLAAELDRLRADTLRAAEIARDDTAAAVAVARDEALSEGRRAGLAAAETREAERLAVLSAGLTEARIQFDARLEAMDVLAAALARTCLERVFARAEAFGDLVAAALERHVSTLRDDALLTVRVSAVDFAETDALDAMVRAAGARAVVTIDRDLPAGACRIAARLGKVDLDVPAQWAALARTLDGMVRA